MSLQWRLIAGDNTVPKTVVGLDAAPFIDAVRDDAARLLINLGEESEITPDLQPVEILRAFNGTLQNTKRLNISELPQSGTLAVTPFIPAEAIPDEAAISDIDAYIEALNIQAPANDRCAAGVIDISIAFVHPSFRYKDAAGHERSRVHMIWLQDRVFKPGARPPSFSGVQLAYGTLLLKRDIDHLITSNIRNGVVDESAIYDLFQKPDDGFRNLWLMRGGHGTAILDLMTGSDDATEADYQPIYAVELPTRVVADTSGDQMFGVTTAALILILATRFLEGIGSFPSPVKGIVINSSLSFTGGPHDGTYDLVRAIDHQLAIYSIFMPIKLCVPRGNHLQDMVHARLPARRGGKLIWSLPPEDTTVSAMEIWRYDRNGKEVSSTTDLEFEVGPSGYAPLPVEPAEFPPPIQGSATVLETTDGRPLAYLTNNGRRLLLTVLPTKAYGGASAPSGLWTVVVKDPNSKEVLCWIKRDDTLKGLRAAGLQSRFYSQSYERRDGYGDWKTDGSYPSEDVYRDGTLSVLATSRNTSGAWRVVTGWEGGFEGPSSYRFSGRKLDTYRPPTPHRPHFFPRAEVSRGLGGPLTAGREARTVVRTSGTSVATAIAARRESEIQCKIPTSHDAELGWRNGLHKRYRF